MKASHKLISLSVCFAAVFIMGCDNHQDTTAGSGSNTTAATIDDSIITTKIKSGLLADPVVRGLDPKVETQKGNVQLSGEVANQAQMDRVIEIACTVGGVKSVENKMSLKK
ncbi:MAG: BON domain-containing protein [Sulfuricaulis sp.]